MKEILETVTKDVYVSLPLELNQEIESIIEEETKYTSKAQFIEIAVRMFLRRIEENKDLI